MNLVLTRVMRFVAVAEQLSFTKAAALLNIDQPGLSRQIMQLEDQLGFILFDRSGMRIALTREGEEFYEIAKLFTIAAEQVNNKAEEMARRMKSVVRVGVSYTTFSVEARTNLITRFTALRPNNQVEFTASESTDEVAANVLAGNVDLGICFGPIIHPELDVCVLAEIEMTLAIPVEDPLAALPEVALADLAGKRIAIGLQSIAAHARMTPYSWVDEVGAEIVRVPEGRQYIFDVAERQRLIVGCYTPSDRIPESFVRRSIRGPKPEINMSLIRYRRVLSSAAERMWQLGQELSALDNAAC